MIAQTKRQSQPVAPVSAACAAFAAQPSVYPPEARRPDVALLYGSVAESAKRRTNSREKSCFAASASKMPEKAKPSDFGRCGEKAAGYGFVKG